MPPPDHDPVRDDADSFEEGEEEDAAALETEADVTCPHCGETMTITLDPGGGRAQEYVEDCQVCCRPRRSEEHTSELQSRSDLVCRLLLEKKNDSSAPPPAPPSPSPPSSGRIAARARTASAPGPW